MQSELPICKLETRIIIRSSFLVEEFEAVSIGESCGIPQNRDKSGLPLLCAVLVESE